MSLRARRRVAGLVRAALGGADTPQTRPQHAPKAPRSTPTATAPLHRSPPATWAARRVSRACAGLFPTAVPAATAGLKVAREWREERQKNKESAGSH